MGNTSTALSLSSPWDTPSHLISSETDPSLLFSAQPLSERAVVCESKYTQSPAVTVVSFRVSSKKTEPQKWLNSVGFYRQKVCWCSLARTTLLTSHGRFDLLKIDYSFISTKNTQNTFLMNISLEFSIMREEFQWLCRSAFWDCFICKSICKSSQNGHIYKISPW